MTSLRKARIFYYIILVILMCSVTKTYAQNKVVVVPLAGNSSISDFEWVTESTPVDSTDSKDLVVSCPPGKVVIGGGVRIFGAGSTQAITVNGPEGQNKWWGQAIEIVPMSDNWGLRVDAACAKINN